MHKVPPDMRKALLIAAQERMDKLSGRTTEQTDDPNLARGTSAPAPAPSRAAPSKSKDDDDLVILQEVSRAGQSLMTDWDRDLIWLLFYNFLFCQLLLVVFYQS